MATGKKRETSKVFSNVPKLAGGVGKSVWGAKNTQVAGKQAAVEPTCARFEKHQAKVREKKVKGGFSDLPMPAKKGRETVRKAGFFGPQTKTVVYNYPKF